MARIAPLSPDQLPAFRPVLEAIERDHGYVPNSFLTMGRDPAVLRATGALAEALWYPETLEQDVRRLVAFSYSLFSGAMYSAAHTACGSDALPLFKALAVRDFETSRVYTERERALLSLCRAAARAPSEVSDSHFERLRRWFDDGQLISITGLIAWHAFLNKWNDIMDTQLEPLPRTYAEASLGPVGWHGLRHSQDGRA